MSFARNRGIERGSSRWIALLDSDDAWEEEKLQKQIEYSDQHPEYPLIHTNEVWMKSMMPFPQKKRHEKSGGRLFLKSIPLCCISPSSSLIKRSLFQELGLFREDFPVCEDYELWLRITARYPVGFLKEPLTIKYGGHQDQLSQAYHSMDYWRVLALNSHRDNPSLSDRERNSVQEMILKKCKILLKGYKKYGNLKNKKEILRIFKEASLYK